MASVFDRIAKRECFKVDGHDLHVREPLIGELSRALAVPVEHQKSMLFALCVVDESGAVLMPQGDGESDADFAKRAHDEVQLMRPTVFKAANDAIGKLLKPVDPAELAKN